MASSKDGIGDILGLQFGSRRLLDIVSEGLPVSAFESVASYTGMTRNALADAAAIPLRTVQRRAGAAHSRFQPAESDRLARVARIFALAEDVLGSRDTADAWMRTANRALDGAPPIAFLNTEIAAREVEDLLGRIRFGVFA